MLEIVPTAGHHDERWYRWGFWALGAFAVALTYSLVAGPRGYETVTEGKEAVAKRSGRAYELIEENARLRARLDGLRSSSRAVEEEARGSLRWVQPDELVLMLSPQDHTDRK